MTIRSASLLAAAALAGLATPALAQQAVYTAPLPTQVPLPTSAGAWQGQSVYVNPGPYQGVTTVGQPPLGVAEVQAPAYTPEQRNEWLEQCRAAYGNEGREEGQVIGGVVGAVAGGVAGNQIAAEHDETEGTLIGAGVGAVAGAAIGGAVGADADRDRVDLCEAQWTQYEPGNRAYRVIDAPGAYAGEGYGYAYPYPYPVIWVKVPISTRSVDYAEETPPLPPLPVALAAVQQEALAYSPEQRAQWLEQCRESYREDLCEAQWTQYEPGNRATRVIDAPGAYAAQGYGYAYPYPYPVVWVKVPITTTSVEYVEETPDQGD